MAAFCDNAKGGLFDFIGDIYKCAVEPDRWPSVLEKTSHLVRGSAATITTHGPVRNFARIAARWNTCRELERAIAVHAAASPAIPAIWLSGESQPFVANASSAESNFGTPRWHQKVVQPFGYHEAMIAPLTKSAETFSAMTIMCPASVEPFLPYEVDVIRGLLPHFRYAAEMAELLDYRSLAQLFRNAALYSVPAGIILTDALGKIVYANDIAGRMLDGRVLFCLEDELSARDSKSGAELRAAIATAGKVANSRGAKATSFLLAKGRPGPDIAIWVAGLGGRLRRESVSPLARVVVLAHAANAPETSPAEMFVRRHDITAADCRLLALLAQGIRLEKAALALSVPLPVARTALIGLVEKTHTRDAADLIGNLTNIRAKISA